MLRIRLFEIDLLSKACAHHSDYSNLLERCLALTIFVRSLEDAEKIKTVVFLKINQVLYRHSSAQGARRSSLILSDDVEGSRQWKAAFDKPLCPHLHGILILSPEDFQSWQHRLPELIEELRGKIKEIEEVGQGAKGSRPARDCHVKITPVFGSVEGWLSYGTKAFGQAFLMGKDFNHPAVFPWDIEIRRGGDKADALERRMEAARAALYPEFFDENGKRRILHVN